MTGVQFSNGKFTDILERHQRNKQLLLINVTYSPVNQTEDTMLQDTLISSFDFGDIKYIATRVELDSVGGKMKLFNEKFPGIDSPGIILVGFEEDGSSKAYDKLPSVCDLSESTAPIFHEYKSYYKKFREENPDFVSDNEELPQAEEKSLEERKKDVQEAIARQRQLKAKLEEQEQLEREIKRREDGKKALEMQEQMKQIEQQRDLEKRRQEKEADAKRLRELRELERRDREERARRKAEAQGSAQPATSTPAPAAESKPQQIASDECRICYQFPDGARVMKVFNSKVKFREVYDAIKDDSHIEGNYKLFTTFPRVAIEDYSKNLVELCLTPASVLAVVKKEPEMQIVNQSVGVLKNAGMMIFTLVCGPLASLFQFFSLLFGFRVENPNEPSESERRIQEQQPQRQQKEHRRRGEGGRRFKKEGNIQGLKDDDESSDDEGTWNGNSTQQL